MTGSLAFVFHALLGDIQSVVILSRADDEESLDIQNQRSTREGSSLRSGMTKGTGSLALILHAHLPFVRHPEHEFFHEENWLFEAISESYVPLLQMIRRLLRRGVRFKLTLSVSPTLCAMLADPLLRDRYIRHLDLLIALAERECERNRAREKFDVALGVLSRIFAETRRTFVEEWDCDLLGVFRQLRGTGAVEIMASAATHAILPILQESPGPANAQIAIGCDQFREIFGGEPSGFWLPECAYAAGSGKVVAGGKYSLVRRRCPCVWTGTCRQRGAELSHHVLQGRDQPLSLAISRPAVRFGAHNRDIPAIRLIAISIATSVSICQPGACTATRKQLYGNKISSRHRLRCCRNKFMIARPRKKRPAGMPIILSRDASTELQSLQAEDWNPIMTVPFRCRTLRTLVV